MRISVIQDIFRYVSMQENTLVTDIDTCLLTSGYPL